MRQLSGLDALFLTLESESAPMHVGGVAVLELAHAPAGFGFRAVRQRIAERLHLLPLMRRRLVQMPLNLVPPFWMEDPDFHLDNHVHRRQLPRPGRDDQLAALVAELIARPLDRRRPLWNCHYVEGLSRRRAALIAIVHHACVDGVSGAELLSKLLDLHPQESNPAGAEDWEPDEMPASWRRGLVAARQTAIRLRQGASLIRRTAPLALDLGRSLLGSSEASAAEPQPWLGGLAAPRTRFNVAIGPERSYALGELPLEPVRRIKTALDTSVNDVVLAICADALRVELGRAGELPDEPLQAAVPMSVRGTAERGAGGNKVTMLRVNLHTDIDDPLERLRAIAGSTARIRKLHRTVPARLLMDWMEVPAPALMARAARLYENFGVGDLVKPPFNVVISNVPGPRRTLYLAGAPLLANYPVSIPYHGLALNITVLSYRDKLDVGLTAYREAMPEPRRFFRRMQASQKALAEAVETAHPARVADPRGRGSRRQSTAQ